MKRLLLFLCCLCFCYADAPCLQLPFDQNWVKNRYKKKKENEPILICVIVHNLGLNNKMTKDILNVLPKEISVSLSAYYKKDKKIMDVIEKNGHNILCVQPFSFYRETSNSQDPYRLDLKNEKSRNASIASKVISNIPQNTVAIIAEESSPTLKDATALHSLLIALKEKNLAMVSPEMSLDDTFKKNCEQMGVAVFEADYFIDDEKTLEETVSILERCKDLATTTGILFLVVEANYFHVKEVLEWIQKFNNSSMKLISFKEFMGCYDSTLNAK